MLQSILMPRLAPLLGDYPEVTLEFDISYGFRDIVADRFDAGVRIGSTIDKDMIAVPIGPPLRMAVVASPAYFAAHGKPRTPGELTAHRCINQRMPTSGGLYVWDFARGGRRSTCESTDRSSSTRRRRKSPRPLPDSASRCCPKTKCQRLWPMVG